jgi:hypothetical protein
MLDKLFDLFVGDMTVDQRRMFMRLAFRGMFVVHIAWACGWLSAVGLNGFAQAGEVESAKTVLSSHIDSVEKKVDSIDAQIVKSRKQQTKVALETELRKLNQDIFTIQARLKELTAAGIKADRIYDERLSDLLDEKRSVESQLDVFLRTNPEVLGAN